MDLSKVPTEDLKAISEGKWDKVSTPGLQAYQGALQQESQAQTQSLNPQTAPDSAQKAAHPSQTAVPQGQPSDLQNYLQKGISAISGVRGGLLKGASWGNLDPSAMSPGFKAGISENPALSGIFQMAGEMASGALVGSVAGVVGGASALGRIGANTVSGGLLGGLAAPRGGQTRLGNSAKGAAMGGMASAALEGVSSLGGELGDYLMQKAVGLRKNTPGVGSTLADLGVVGTKNMMANQVESKLADEETALQKTVESLSGTVNSKEIADAVSQKAQRFTLPSSGQASPFSQSELNKVRDTAEKLSGMGDLSASDLLALKRQGDYQGFTAGGNPATSTEAELGRTGANAARQALKKMSPDVADSLLNEQALIKAKGALNKPESIHQGMGSSLFFGKAPGQALISSLLGQAADKGGNVAETAADPAVLQSLFGVANSTRK